MAETKTKQTKASVRDFVAAVENDTRRADAKALLKLFATPRHGEPNDRGYDRKLEKLVKRLSPEEPSKLLNDDGQADG
jgi:hypothetical protein